MIEALGADIVVCDRRDDDPPGDPALLRFREAVAAGALPFTVQGPENALCLDAGRTLGWEIADAVGGAGGPAALDRVVVQVGGGALAACVGWGLGPEVRLDTVQAQGCAPLARAWWRAKDAGYADAQLPGRWQELMTPWERPHSIADGILDDETYDWLADFAVMASSGGRPIVVPEEAIVDAADVAAATGIDVSATGSAASPASSSPMADRQPARPWPSSSPVCAAADDRTGRTRRRHVALASMNEPMPPLSPRMLDVAVDPRSDVFNRLLKDRVVMLGAAVDDDIANQLCAQLLYLEGEDKDRDIWLYINSPGGSVTSGMAIYDTMQFVSCDVATVCIGLAASMGQFLLTAGASGKRYSLPNARILMHQPLAGMRGQAADIAIQAQEFSYTKKRMFELISLHSGRPVEQIEADADRDRWFSAEEAKDYGLCDHVIVRRGEIR